MSSYNVFPAFIGVWETKLNTNSNVDLMSLENYSLVNSETRSGGVLIYIKTQF